MWQNISKKITLKFKTILTLLFIILITYVVSYILLLRIIHNILLKHSLTFSFETEISENIVLSNYFCIFIDYKIHL